MRKTYQVLAYLLAAEVVINGMAMAYGIAGLGKWVDDGHAFTKAILNQDNPDFQGAGGFMIHGLNGMMIIPLVALALLVVSFFAKVASGTRQALILLGMVVLQVVLGLAGHSVPALAPLHVLNAFGIFSMAALTAYNVRPADVRAATPAPEVATV